MRQVYRADLETAKTPEQKAALATKLIIAARQTNDDLAGRYMLVKVAQEVAISAGDSGWTVASLQELAVYDVDYFTSAQEAMESLAKTVRSVSGHRSLCYAAGAIIAPAFLADRFEEAKAIANIALVSAKRTDDDSIVAKWTARVNEIEIATTAFASVKPALAKLTETPTYRFWRRTVELLG